VNDNPQRPSDAHERIEAALADLHLADAINLAEASNTSLVRLVEQLRGSLADMIRFSQGCCPTPKNHN
jgi:hypothetical protein